MATHTIRNNQLSVSVNAFGAEINSLNYSGHELLWQADKAIWPRYAPILFPIVGKLKNDAYTFEGKEYKMSQHGFARDKEFILILKEEHVLEFELTAGEETLKIYPFHFSLIIRYEINGGKLDITYKVFNPDNKDLHFSIGAHPGFSCMRIPGESLSDFSLVFPGKNKLIAEKLSGGLLSGESYPVQLNGDRIALSPALFDNDALVFKNNQIDDVELSSSKSRISLRLKSHGWPYYGIWSKKGTDGFVCLEPWYGIADSIENTGDLHDKPGIIRLKPHDTFQASYSILVSGN